MAGSHRARPGARRRHRQGCGGVRRAEKLVAELEERGIEVIYDDRKKVSPGVKFKDAELIGVPLIAVAYRDTVNNGTIEIRNRDSSDSVAVPVADAAQTLASRLDTLLGK